MGDMISSPLFLGVAKSLRIHVPPRRRIYRFLANPTSFFQPDEIP